ncbi:SRPBCC domain-containing protein [Paractinoplanes ferrugineus]|uniref:Activator of Hsp90 ATPase homologue 1/2-like C-terminal domain-containing protein n=1 Tax=Paractinoplanes ferrugineus TaxID=113564 RepID=A0A919IZ47_9ACTN|nr:SRPBCC domain-containing protein [Actinoplanes ferrugineus]GIE11090.1 hypothetical protein Afe05nite_29300 [Actinoplanes ferrugineus]
MIGETKDAGFQIGVARTIPFPAATVWEFVAGAEGQAVWLGPGAALTAAKGAPYRTESGISGEVRSFHEHDRIRLTWRPPGGDHETTVQVTVRPVAGDRATLRFHQERLSGPDERAEQRAHWQAVLESVTEALSRSGKRS